MPRYFFHIDDGQMLADADGTDLPDLQSARGEAVSVAGAILKDMNGAFWDQTSAWRMHVTDEAGGLLFTLRFSADVPSGLVKFYPQ